MKTHTFIPLLAATGLLCACMPAQDPQTVAAAYWQHIQQGDLAGARKLVASNSQQAFDDAAYQQRIKQLGKIQTIELNPPQTTIATWLTPAGQQPAPAPFNTTLVLENGQWKIDAAHSRIPAPAPPPAAENDTLHTQALKKNLQHSLDNIDEAMQEGIKLLNDAVRESSSEMSESLLKAMKALNEAMEKSLDNLKKRRQQQHNAPTAPAPDPEKGEGVI